MNLLIIGGSGFVSGTLARIALEHGHSVSTVTRGQREIPDGAQSIVVDRKDREAFAQTVHAHGGEWDLVADCIGYEPEDAKQDIECFKNRARHLVFVSTDFVYAPSGRVHPQPEDGLYRADSSYGHKKRLCELEILEGDTGGMAWTILRPCHIYGPGSLPGCLPNYSRDPDLLQKMKDGQALALVGGGYFLQQPIFAPDLAELILSCADNESCESGIFNAAGPDMIESKKYYEIIGDVLGVETNFEEIPVDEYLKENPEKNAFICHRIYDLTRLHESGLKVPATSIQEGLRIHTESLLKD
ncbi:MAG: NAD-dependent epimerase/dehydratase family protein [Planctomycetota bacterium]|nr:NAD-dependent epimerase/dehydratase family protein [Planctomycetota bacterium]